MTITQIDDDVRILATRIPESHHLDGLHYGSHAGRQGGCGYHVRMPDGNVWGVARLTPADDELVGDDDEIVAAIADELI